MKNSFYSKFKIQRTEDSFYTKEYNYKKIKDSHLHLITCLKKDLKKIKAGELKEKIVDFGSGNGELINYLNIHFPQTTLIGVDPSKELIKVAKKYVKKKNKNINFLKGSVLNKNLFKKQTNDISFSCGLLPIFDEFQTPINNIINWSKKKGKIYIGSLFSDFPYDVFVKYRHSKNFKKNTVESGWNIFSKKSISSFLKSHKKVKTFKFDDFNFKRNVKKNKNDYVRSWTFKDSKGKYFTTNGLNLILPASMLKIYLK